MRRPVVILGLLILATGGGWSRGEVWAAERGSRFRQRLERLRKERRQRREERRGRETEEKRASKRLEIGAKAPDFVLTDPLTKRRITLKDLLKGEAALIVFFKLEEGLRLPEAVTFVESLYEHPERIHEKLDPPKLGCLAIAVGGDRSLLLRSLQGQDLKIRIAHDQREQTAAAYGADPGKVQLPLVFVLDKDGTVLLREEGFLYGVRMRVIRTLQSLLRQRGYPAEGAVALGETATGAPAEQIDLKKVRSQLLEIRSLWRQGKTEAALTRARELTQTVPTSSEAQIWLGFLLEVTKRYDEAIGAYERAVQLDPRSTYARAGLRRLGIYYVPSSPGTSGNQ
ncbi:MAG TPA: tetratricopeptide repeat protein [Armatimonadetes bacterium]|nr:tetratricopeptide repeat protein [Armatimonadota bacterium]